MKVVVIGASGNLGSATIGALTADGAANAAGTRRLLDALIGA